jgi:hypothetical protein
MNGGQMNGNHHGFSHGAFATNQPGYADRHPDRSNNMSINTGRLAPGHQNGMDMQTPGTGYDMNFTPLLPSQLLLGSPFQPGSPSAFASPQFQSYANFAQQNQAQQQNHQSQQVGSPLQQPLSPQLYQNLSLRQA